MEEKRGPGRPVGRPPGLGGKYAAVQQRRKHAAAAAQDTSSAKPAKRPGRKPSHGGSQTATAEPGAGAGRPAASVTRSNSQDDDPTLVEHQLRDGLRVLARLEGGSHFYAGRLNAVRPPDIYGILLDNERGFRPVIYAREELLKDAVREVKVRSLADLAIGARVAAYWSAKYQFLHPGTVVPHEEGSRANSKYVNIELDDGDSREIHVDQVSIFICVLCRCGGIQF